MKKLVCVAAGLAFLAILVLSTNSSGAAQDKAKFTIADVMQKAHKSGLMKSIAEGKGSADEKKQLIEFYTALGQNTPPKGEAKDWKEKTMKMLALAKDIEKGDKDAGAKLVKEANCGGCHKAFRN